MSSAALTAASRAVARSSGALVTRRLSLDFVPARGLSMLAIPSRKSQLQGAASPGCARGREFSSFPEQLHLAAYGEGLRDKQLWEVRKWADKAKLSPAQMRAVLQLLGSSSIRIVREGGLSPAAVRELRGEGAARGILALTPKVPLHWYSQGEVLTLFLEKPATVRCVSNVPAETQDIVSFSVPAGIVNLDIRPHTICRLESAGEGALLVNPTEPEAARRKERGLFMLKEGDLPLYVRQMRKADRHWKEAAQDAPIPWQVLPFLPREIVMSESVDR